MRFCQGKKRFILCPTKTRSLLPSSTYNVSGRVICSLRVGFPFRLSKILPRFLFLMFKVIAPAARIIAERDSAAGGRIAERKDLK